MTMMKILVAAICWWSLALLSLSSDAAAAVTADDEFAGMKVLCVGCSSGMGLATAKKLLEGGAEVVLSSRTQSKLNAIAKDYANAYAVAADAGNLEGLDALVSQARDALGGTLTHLVWIPMGDQLVSYASDDIDAILSSFESQIGVNVYGLLKTFKLIETDLIANKGSVVTMSSVGGEHPYIGAPAYGVSKAAQEMLVKTLALEVAADGVRVNAVAPGGILTSAFDGYGPFKQTVLDDFAWRHAMGRMGTSEEVAELIVFLLDNKRASFMTGQTVAIDGGMSLYNSFVDIVSPYVTPPEKLQQKYMVFQQRQMPAGAEADQAEL